LLVDGCYVLMKLIQGLRRDEFFKFRMTIYLNNMENLEGKHWGMKSGRHHLNILTSDNKLTLRKH